MIRKQFTALVQEGGFGTREKNEIFLIFMLLKLYQIMTKRENISTLRQMQSIHLTNAMRILARLLDMSNCFVL
jgi:hypothetical protein